MHKLDRQVQEKVYMLQRERETQQQIQRVKTANIPDSPNGVEKAKLDTAMPDRANTKRKASKQEAMDRTLQILKDEPAASLTDIARRLGRSRQTIYDYLDELEAAGKLHRNGSISIIT